MPVAHISRFRVCRPLGNSISGWLSDQVNGSKSHASYIRDLRQSIRATSGGGFRPGSRNPMTPPSSHFQIPEVRSSSRYRQELAKDGHSPPRYEGEQSASASRHLSKTDYRLKQQSKRCAYKQECCYRCFEQDSDPVFWNVRVVCKY